MRSKGSSSRKAAGSGKRSSLIIAGHFDETRTAITEARTRWDNARRDWILARASFRGLSPLDDSYSAAADRLQRATERYTSASQNLLKVCERA